MALIMAEGLSSTSFAGIASLQPTLASEASLLVVEMRRSGVAIAMAPCHYLPICLPVMRYAVHQQAPGTWYRLDTTTIPS